MNTFTELVMNKKVMSVLLPLYVLFLCALVGCDAPMGGYKRLTMYNQDGTKKVFVGVSPCTNGNKVTYRTRDGRDHTHCGNYLLEQISKEEYDKFGSGSAVIVPAAEAVGTNQK